MYHVSPQRINDVSIITKHSKSCEYIMEYTELKYIFCIIYFTFSFLKRWHYFHESFIQRKSIAMSLEIIL